MKAHLMKQYINLFSLKRPDDEEKIKIHLYVWSFFGLLVLIGEIT